MDVKYTQQGPYFYSEHKNKFICNFLLKLQILVKKIEFLFYRNPKYKINDKVILTDGKSVKIVDTYKNNILLDPYEYIVIRTHSEYRDPINPSKPLKSATIINEDEIRS